MDDLFPLKEDLEADKMTEREDRRRSAAIVTTITVRTFGL